MAGFGLYPDGDRRRRPRATLSAAQVQALLSEGTLSPTSNLGEYALSAAGMARLLREASAMHAGHAPHAQNQKFSPLSDGKPDSAVPESGLVERAVITEDGAIEMAMAREACPVVARLARQMDPSGKPWLDRAEVAAAKRLAEDFEAGSRGRMRGSRSDGLGPRGAPVGVRGSGGAEAALAIGFEARARASRALESLSPCLRSVVEAVCLRDITLEALERQGLWPARSGKLALKLALSQLAQAYRGL